MSRATGLFALLLTPFLAAWVGCAPAPPAAAVNATETSALVSESVVSNHYLGRVSCAATGCHGLPSSAGRSWSNAYQIWDSEDPHRWAFDALYSERSYQIYAKLEQPAEKTVDKATYLKFLVDRCVGCHATPPDKTQLTSTGRPQLFTADEPEEFSQGVSCESCHGPAGGWEGEHFLLSWKKKTPEERAELKQEYGFQDLRPLASRAAVCVKCHVGPQIVGDDSGRKVYDMNHDLIAAGHPRLNFEFNAYLSNLPKHWSEAAGKARQGPQVAKHFHFEAWRVGQMEKQAQDTRLRAERAKINAGNPAGKWAEFANHDCRECHHAIGEPNFVWNKRKPWSLTAFTKHSTLQEQANLVSALLCCSKEAADSLAAPGFDEAVDLYLAANSLSQDQVAATPALKANPSEFMQAVAALRAEIERQHFDEDGKPDYDKTQYDLIDHFNPQTKEFRDAIRALESALKNFP